MSVVWSTTIRDHGTPVPRTFFFKLFERSGLPTQAALARQLDVSSQQIARWKSGAERIPDEAFRRLQPFVGLTATEDLIWTVARVVEDTTARIAARLRGFFRLQEEDLQKCRVAVMKITLDIHSSRPHLNAYMELVSLQYAVLAVETAIKDATRFYSPTQGGDEFLTEGNIARHLRHPVNLASIALIKFWQEMPHLAPLAARVMDNLTDIAEFAPRSIAEHRMTEHVIHLLSRLGDAEVTDRLKFAARLDDPYIKRAHLIARTLHGDVEPIISHMLDEDEIGRAVVEFERVHYFDAQVNSDGKYDLRSKKAGGAINSIGGVLLRGTDTFRDEIRKVYIAKLIERADWRDPSVLMPESMIGKLIDQFADSSGSGKPHQLFTQRLKELRSLRPQEDVYASRD